jgi:hypothetical protein
MPPADPNARQLPRLDQPACPKARALDHRRGSTDPTLDSESYILTIVEGPEQAKVVGAKERGKTATLLILPGASRVLIGGAMHENRPQNHRPDSNNQTGHKRSQRPGKVCVCVFVEPRPYVLLTRDQKLAFQPLFQPTL